jgi:uncharacterized protein YegL
MSDNDLLTKVAQLLRSISSANKEDVRLQKLVQLRDMFENEDEEVLDVLFKHLSQQSVKNHSHILRVLYNVLKIEMENVQEVNAADCLAATLSSLVS